MSNDTASYGTKDGTAYSLIADLRFCSGSEDSEYKCGDYDFFHGTYAI